MLAPHQQHVRLSPPDADAPRNRLPRLDVLPPRLLRFDGFFRSLQLHWRSSALHRYWDCGSGLLGASDEPLKPSRCPNSVLVGYAPSGTASTCISPHNIIRTHPNTSYFSYKLSRFQLALLAIFNVLHAVTLMLLVDSEVRYSLIATDSSCSRFQSLNQRLAGIPAS